MPAPADLERVRYVAGHYCELQGLILVPFGLMYLFLGVFGGAWLQGGDLNWRAGWIGSALLLAWLVTIYYRRVVGRAWPAIRARSSYRPLVIAVVVALVLAFFAAPWIDALAEPPFSVTALAISGLALIPYLAARRRYRVHYLYLALAYAAISLLPLTGVVGSARLTRDPQLFGWLFGLPWIIAGLGDHIFLMRSLKPVPREAPDASL